MGFNTNNPLGSSDERDFYDNSANLDKALNSEAENWTDRLGVERPTVDYVLKQAGFAPAGFDFLTGGTLRAIDRNKCVFNQADQTWYMWQGDLPKTVAANSTPNPLGDNGWKPANLKATEIQAREALRRSYAEAGLNMVDGSFEKGGILVNANDVLLHEATGKCYSWTGIYPGGGYIVQKGTQPLGTDWKERIYTTGSVLVDSYRVLTMTDTDAIDAAMSANKRVRFLARKYIYTKELILEGHELEGVISETWNGYGTNIEFDIPVTPASGFAIRNIKKKSYIKNIRFTQKSWNIQLNGFKPERLVSGENIEFSYFNGHGVVLTSVDAKSESCYSSSFKNIACAFNAKHGIVFGGACNAVVLDNPRCNWNGSPSYGVAPTNPSDYDGIYSGGKNSEFPGNPGIFNDPQGCVIIGGDLSYNSRHGLNLDRYFDGLVLGGYGEGNLVKDIKIRAMYGSNIVNYMAEKSPDVAVPSPDPLNSSMGLTIYPNRIIIRGKSYGNGTLSNTAGYYEQVMDALRTVGALGSLKMTPTADGGVLFTKAGGDQIKTHYGDVPLLARRVGLGDGFTDTDTVTRLAPTIRRAGNTEGDEALIVETASQSLRLFVANGGNSSTTACAAIVPKNTATGRSLNLGGTVNATGADYAEYMFKELNCGVIGKGDVCGVTVNGKLTTEYERSISFVIKSTEPSYVGGDNWFSKEPPLLKEDDLNDQGAIEEYKKQLAVFDEQRELARMAVDRIAFSGQVPCNVLDAKPGDFIIPINSNGKISAQAVTNPDFDQYIKAIGKVWTILPDGRCWIVVKPV